MARKSAAAGGEGRSPAKRASRDLDALEILVSEHRSFDALLAEGEGSTERAGERRRKLLERLISELAIHERMEEQVLYPALLSYAHARETLSEGLHEHDSAEAIANELKGIPTDSPEWGRRFKVLKETLQDHLAHEEQHLFPVARQVFSGEELHELANRMRLLRRQLRPSNR